MPLSVPCGIFVNMKVADVVIHRIEVYVMNNLAVFCVGDFSMLPRPSSRVRAIAETMIQLHCFSEWTVRPFYRSVCLRRGFCKSNSDRGDNFIPMPHWIDIRSQIIPLVIGIESVSVKFPHLIMPHAHFASFNRTITMAACAAHHFSTPPIFGRSMFLYALIVHQAITISRMFPIATVNRAFAVKLWGAHLFIITYREVLYNVLDNGMKETPCSP